MKIKERLKSMEGKSVGIYIPGVDGPIFCTIINVTEDEVECSYRNDKLFVPIDKVCGVRYK